MKCSFPFFNCSSMSDEKSIVNFPHRTIKSLITSPSSSVMRYMLLKSLLFAWLEINAFLVIDILWRLREMTIPFEFSLKLEKASILDALDTFVEELARFRQPQVNIWVTRQLFYLPVHEFLSLLVVFYDKQRVLLYSQTLSHKALSRNSYLQRVSLPSEDKIVFFDLFCCRVENVSRCPFLDHSTLLINNNRWCDNLIGSGPCCEFYPNSIQILIHT